jgi:DNA-binding LacI/PurR family transcriptional regulator
LQSDVREIGAEGQAIIGVAPLKRATSMDVAKRAGVTQPTVSRALRGHPTVHPETRQRVVDAAQQLNYVVDQKASSLRRQRTNAIALVVMCRPGETRSAINPFYFGLLGSIAAAASRRHYDLIVSFQDDEETFRADFIEAGLADAVIVIGTTMNAAGWNFLHETAGRGTNLICWRRPDDSFDSICSDNETGARIATEHLLQQGCRDIVFIGPLGSPQRQFDERFQSYAKALAERNLPSRSIISDGSNNRLIQGYDAVRKLIEDGIKFDGIIAACDMIALGVLKALKEHRVAVPDEVAVVGFDGIREGEVCEPTLTTIEPDLDAAGTILVEKALNVHNRVHVSHRVPVRLVTRASG